MGGERATDRRTVRTEYRVASIEHAKHSTDDDEDDDDDDDEDSSRSARQIELGAQQEIKNGEKQQKKK